MGSAGSSGSMSWSIRSVPGQFSNGGKDFRGFVPLEFARIGSGNAVEDTGGFGAYR
jgi:hypothetical protein